MLSPKQQAQQAAQAAQQAAAAAQQQQIMQIKQEVVGQPQTIQLQNGQQMQVVQIQSNGQITGDPITVVTPQQLASPGGGLPQGAQLVTLPGPNSQPMSPQAVTVTVTPSGNVVSTQ